MSGFGHFLLSSCILGNAIWFFSICVKHINTDLIFPFFFFILLLHIGALAGSIFCSSIAWHVKIPSNIKGLVGSCLVIPCTFDYYRYPPHKPDRVVWYQYVDRGYPVVYDDWHPNDVLSMFYGKTRVFTSTYKKICSLEIKPVTKRHHRQKIYPWVDPENVGKTTYRFFDTTVTIEVVGK